MTEQLIVRNVVFYDPDTGAIKFSAQLSDSSLDADPRPWLETTDFDPAYNLTHEVVGDPPTLQVKS